MLSFRLLSHVKNREYKNISLNTTSCMRSLKICNRRMKRRLSKCKEHIGRLINITETTRRSSRLSPSWTWWDRIFRSRKPLMKWRRSTCKKRPTGSKNGAKTFKSKSGSCVQAMLNWALIWSSSSKNMKARAISLRLSKRQTRTTKTKLKVFFQRTPRGMSCWVSTINGF